MAIRTRQKASVDENNKITPRQETEKIRISKNSIPEMKPVPTTSFIPRTSGSGIFGIGLLAPRPEVPVDYALNDVSRKNIPILNSPLTYNYFFVEYDNQNLSKEFEDIIKSFCVILTLSPVTVKDCSEMLRISIYNITPLTLEEYETGVFNHPKYINDSNEPLSVRYAEIPILKQTIPGRLDNIPIGYPDFDSTPDGVITKKGPIPSPPYTDFISSTGATVSVTISVGEIVYFRDASVSTPPQFAPTSWYWIFGPSASPSQSFYRNPSVVYNYPGSYEVTLTASNYSGETTKVKYNFVNVI